MSQADRMADKAKRMGEEAQDRAQRPGDQFESAAEGGFEAANRSLGEVNKGFQALATEMTDFSKSRFDDVVHAWEQLLRARSGPGGSDRASSCRRKAGMLPAL